MTINEIIIFFLVLIVTSVFGIVLAKALTVRNDNEFWRRPIQNFPFTYKSRTLWYSRACATVLFIFCRNEKDEWCVAVNKRGEGAPDYKGFWNAPCGYLEFHVNGEENAVKEAREECGLVIDPKKVKFYNVDTSPSANRQNVTLRYYTVLEGTTNDYTFSTKEMEEGEVSDVQWATIKSIDSYPMAFNHDTLIKEISNFLMLD